MDPKRSTALADALHRTPGVRRAVLVGSGALFLLTLGVNAALLSGCAQESPSAKVDRSIREEVAAASYPAAYLAGQIAGGLVPIEALSPSGVAPEVYRPSRADIERLQRARLILINGAGLEPWVQAVSLPRSRVVSTAAGFSDRWLTIDSGITHSHGIAGEHTHRGPDGYTWLDPSLLAEQARSVHKALRDAFPEHADVFDTNLADLLDRIAELEARLLALQPLAADRVLVARTPSYNYLARRLGITIEFVEDDAPSSSVILIDETLPEDDAPNGAVRFPVHAATPMDSTVDLIDDIASGLDRLAAGLESRG